jgi:putative transcriptional regulator
VLVCELNEEGALGLILNRPTDLAVSEVLPMWTVDDPPVVHVGGPVQPEVAVGLGRHRGHEPIGFSAVSGRIGLFDLATPHEVVGESLANLRVFSGYAGWGPGQLDGELMSGDWIVVDAEDGDVFGAAGDRLWSSVLRRQGGEIALLAAFGEDPNLN